MRKEIKKRIAGLLLLLFTVSAGFPVQAGEVSVRESQGVVSIQTDVLNVRKGPGKEYDALGKAKAGEEYTVSGETDNGWYRIDYNGTEGYVTGEYVQLLEGGQKEEAPGAEVPEEERAPIPGLPGIWQKIKAGGIFAVAIVILIPVVIIGLIFTVRGMLGPGEEEYDPEEEAYDPEDNEYDPEDEYDDEDGDAEAYSEEIYDGGEAYGEAEYADRSAEYEEDEEEDLQEERAREAFLSREVAPYIEEEAALRREAEELEAKRAESEDQETDEELQRAMEKLAELQKEIERIKQKK